MQLTDLQYFLSKEAEVFNQFAAPFSEAEFTAQPNERWSVGDTAQHLYLSARPVLRLVTGPREAFAPWGYAEKPARSYSEIDEAYRQRLGTGLKAPANFLPRPNDVPDSKAILLARLTDTYLALADELAHWNEAELDRYQMPHPALGLVSVREMVYFIGVHTRHHIAVLQAY